jgi:hypothetical protein
MTIVDGLPKTIVAGVIVCNISSSQILQFEPWNRQKSAHRPHFQKFTWLEPVRAVTRGFAVHFYYALAIVSHISWFFAVHLNSFMNIFWVGGIARPFWWISREVLRATPSGHPYSQLSRNSILQLVLNEVPKNPKRQIYPGSTTTAQLMKLQQFRRMKIFACSFSCTCLFQSWRRPCWVETYLLKYLLSQNCLFTLSLALTPSLNIIFCHK